MMVIYSVHAPREEPDYYATKREALAEAKRLAAAGVSDVEVTRDTIVKKPGRYFAVMLLNGRGWCEASSVVAVVNS